MRKLFYFILLIGMTVACESDEIEFLDDELTRVEQESKDRDTDIVNALNSAVDALNAAIKTEADIRAAQIQGIAELLLATKATLTAMIAAEELARIKGDADLAADLKSNIDKLTAAIALEEDARIAGDEANANAIAEAVTELSAAIGAESRARARGDAQLAGTISDAVDTINESIAVEIDARIAGDESLEEFVKRVRKRLNKNIDAAESAAIQGDADTLAAATAQARLLDDLLQGQIDRNSGEITDAFNLIADLQDSLDDQDVELKGLIQNVQTALANAIVNLQDADDAQFEELSGIITAFNRALNAADADIKATLDELIAALEEQDIATETFLGQITRLFEDAGYTVNGNVVTKAEATVTIRSTDFILLVDGVNISLSNQSLSGDAQDDFDHINSNVVKRCLLYTSPSPRDS